MNLIGWSAGILAGFLTFPMIVRGQIAPVFPLAPLLIPELPAAISPEGSGTSDTSGDDDETRVFIPLFRLNMPYYDNVFAVPEPASPFRLDSSAEEPQQISTAPSQGLVPKLPKTGAWTYAIAAGVAQSFDSNIEQSTTHRISDTFTSPTLSATLQGGSPDSAYSPVYDTILALNLHYELSGDIFASHSEFDAINQRLRAEGRIGRSSAIWRPFVQADDVTGSNLLTVERVGRVERQHLETGMRSDFQLTSTVALSETFSHLFFNHPANDNFVNFDVWRTHQELGDRAFQNMDLFLWNEYSYTNPNEGSAGEEIVNGLGWRGTPDPRLFTDFLIGWDEQHLSGDVPGRRDQSGVRISGNTRFDWSSRLRLTFKYDRSYTFNEQTPNNNYVSNTIQFLPEIFLGGNIYVTPYFGISYDEFESSYQESLEFRPELEVAYALPTDSRVFVKIGYDHQMTLSGPSLPVDIYRASVGFNWKF